MGVDRRAIGGPSARVLANGVEVGWAENVSGSEDITNRAVEVLGDIDPEEIVPVRRRAEFSAGLVRIREEHATKMGIWPKGGTVDVMRMPPLVFEVVDDDGNAIERILGCRSKSRRWSVDAGGIFSENCSWDAVRSEPVLGT